MKARITFYLLIFSSLVFGQREEEKQAIIEQRIEFIGESLEDSDIDLTTFFDDLFAFYDNPINLNTTTQEELMRLHLLTDLQIVSLLHYRDFFGDFITIYELAAIEEIDHITLEMILPFITVNPVQKDNFQWKNAVRYGTHEILMRYQNTFEQKEGYIPKSDSILALFPNRQYLGSSDRLYFRYRNTYKDRLSWGVTGDKDAGEEFFRGTQKQGFDFYSAHLFARKLWKFNAVALGDYQVNVGQGLTIWSGFGIGKSANVMNGKRFATGLRPYTSVNENQFLRGGAVNLQFGGWDMIYFASSKKVDAHVNASDSLDFFDSNFSSFQISGLHSAIIAVSLHADSADESRFRGSSSWQLREKADLFLWRSQLFEGLACGGLKKATGSWLLAASRSSNGQGAAGIQRRCELIRFWHEWRWPVRENLLS
jgi:hypothetical protein